MFWFRNKKINSGKHSKLKACMFGESESNCDKIEVAMAIHVQSKILNLHILNLLVIYGFLKTSTIAIQ